MINWLDKKEDSGQALVLIAFLMVVLLGFTALAIDGGRLYFLSRDAQNAADASVVAGVYALCAGENVQAAVENAASLNGFVNDSDNPNRVQTIYPYDIDGDGLDSPGKDDNYLQVIIDDSIPPTFAQIVYDGPLSVSVPASGQCVQAISVAEIGAAFAGGEGCGNDGLNFQGSAFNITGGMFSNSGVRLNGSSGHTDNVDGDANAVGTVDDQNIDWAAGSGGNDNQDPIPMPVLWDIGDFRPTGDWAVIADAQGSGEYFYWDETLSSNGAADDLDEFRRMSDNVTADTLVSSGAMAEGIYYSEAAITINLNSIDATGVTWVSELGISPGVNTSTIVRIYNEDDHVDTSAMSPPYTDANFPVMPLFFSNAGDRTCNLNANEGITISGNQLNNFYGVWYAPNGQIDGSMSAGTGYGSFIAWTVSISASTFTIEYVPELIPPISPWGMLVE